MGSLRAAKLLIESLPGSARIIELAGPTPEGNEFLLRNKIRLSAKSLVTNVVNPAVFYGLPPYPKKYAVDETADVRQLSYSDVDMFLCSYLTWFQQRHYGDNSFVRRTLAGFHYNLGYTDSRINLHISLFRETSRALRSKGLLLVEGTKEQDFSIATKCGFELIYADDNDAALFQIRDNIDS